MKIKTKIIENDTQRGYWIAGIAVSIALLLHVFTLLLPRIYDQVLTEKTTLLYPVNSENIEIRTERVELNEGGEYRPTDGDPQIIFAFADPIEIQSFKIVFRNPLTERTEIQLYYAGEGQGYSEDRVQKVWIDQNAKDFSVDIPAGATVHLRVDINGNCTIDSITISPDYTQKSINWKIVLLILIGTILLSIIIVLVFLIICDVKMEMSRDGVGQRRLLHIELMRIIAAYFVIFNHTGKWGYTLFQSYESSTFIYWYYLLVSAMCKVSVPLFFMMSGALLLKKEEEPARKTAKRFIRILIVLFLFSILSYAQQIHFGNESLDIGRFLNVFVSSNWMSPYWYLYAYMGFLISLPLLRRFAKSLRNSDYKYMIIIVVIITGVVPVIIYILSKGRLSLNSDFNITWISSQICFYPLIGYYLENRMDVKKVTNRKLLLLWIINTLSLIATCYVTTINNAIQGGFPQTFMMSMVPINAICIYITTKKGMHKSNPGKKVSFLLTEIGACTFGVYLFHGFFLRDSSLSLYLRIEYIFNFAPLLRELLRCLEVMMICGLLTWTIKKLPLVKKMI